MEKEAELKAKEASEKTGIENVAYETDETEKKPQKRNTTEDNNINDSVTQSQIEMGFIESMVNNSKVQH